MLNYIWLALIAIGIVVAIGYDVKDFSQDTYRNNQELAIRISCDEDVQTPRKEYQCKVIVDVQLLYDFYGEQPSANVQSQEEVLPAILTLRDRGEGRLLIDVSKTTFKRWREMAKLQGNEQHKLQGSVRLEGKQGQLQIAYFQIDPIKFVTIKKVSNEGTFRYAKIAVEIAIGLIGIMALWLGIMRIAEQSGLILKIASVVKPIMTRLFPDVPADHPAMGAMIMNISANMLGLANAATPLGLKAMEELNKLNKKLGTATDAMCTFLVINTSNVQLIPATVIAIRAAAGSANPTEIIGPVIVATTISTVVGVIVVKLLSRLKFYRDQLKTDVIET